MFVKSKMLEGSEIVHGFFGRQGGVSQGFYAGLNCGLGTPDPAVAENRVAVTRALGLDEILSVRQVHSAVCVKVDEPWTAENRPEADAMITDVPGLGLGILTADCAPVLFCGEKADGRPVVGAAHAGWGGALEGVLEATVEALLEAGAVKGSLRAAIGPCIMPQSYEVSAGFETPFIVQDKANGQFFVAAEREGHLMFDLPGYAVRRLKLAGVPDTGLCDIDTYASEKGYFSYRRAVHRGEPDYGRQMSVIGIRNDK